MCCFISCIVRTLKQSAAVDEVQWILIFGGVVGSMTCVIFVMASVMCRRGLCKTGKTSIYFNRWYSKKTLIHITQSKSNGLTFFQHYLYMHRLVYT